MKFKGGTAAFRVEAGRWSGLEEGQEGMWTMNMHMERGEVKRMCCSVIDKEWRDSRNG